MGLNTIVIAAGILLVALLTNWFFLRRRHPVVGYFAGLITIYTPWQIYMLQLPSAKECNAQPLACEWVGIGIVFVSGIAILIAVIFSALSVGMVSYHRKVSSLDLPQKSSSSEKTRVATNILLTLIVTTILGFWGGQGMIHLYQKGAFVRWQSLGRPAEETFPPAEKGEEVIGLHSFSRGEIRVKTNKNRVYATSVEGCLRMDAIGANCWYSVISDDFPERGFNNCEPSFWIGNPPGTVIYQTQTGRCGGKQVEISKFVLLDDGSVWVWHHEIITEAWMMELIGGMPGSIIGLVVGMIIVFVRNRQGVPK